MLAARLFIDAPDSASLTTIGAYWNATDLAGMATAADTMASDVAAYTTDFENDVQTPLDSYSAALNQSQLAYLNATSVRGWAKTMKGGSRKKRGWGGWVGGWVGVGWGVGLGLGWGTCWWRRAATVELAFLHAETPHG